MVHPFSDHGDLADGIAAPAIFTSGTAAFLADYIHLRDRLPQAGAGLPGSRAEREYVSVFGFPKRDGNAKDLMTG
jgi:hypothetical protein